MYVNCANSIPLTCFDENREQCNDDSTVVVLQMNLSVYVKVRIPHILVQMVGNAST